MSNETKILPNVSPSGLEALASAMLVPGEQSRLNELLSRNAEGNITDEELSELDRLVKQVDELNLLKARAEFTLRHQSETGTS